MNKIIFKVQENGDPVEGGNTSAPCHGLEDIKHTIAEVLENVIEKELNTEFERSIELSSHLRNTFLVREANGGDKVVECQVTGLSAQDALELTSLDGDLD
jgi:hypothetical protein